MTQLEQSFQTINATSLSIVQVHSAQFTHFCQTQNALFERVTLNKPDKPAYQHLLGLLTKAHLELSSTLESQQETNVKLKAVIRDTLGEEHQHRFHDQTLEQFVLVCHLWFYLQGYLGMDFSLANDHAEQSSALICRLQAGDPQAMRSDMMSSFYHGLELNAQHFPKVSFWQKVKTRWFTAK